MLYVFCAVLCVSFCTGHFVMVPLNLTYLHCLQHSLFEHLFISYYDHEHHERYLNILNVRKYRHAYAQLRSGFYKLEPQIEKVVI